MKKILFATHRFTYLVLVVFLLLFSSFVLNADTGNIKISGNKRISDETVMLVSGLFGHSELSANLLNNALKNLNKSGLFSQVKIKRESDYVSIELLENPLITEVLFEGNKVVSDDDLSLIIESSPQNAFSKGAVLLDVNNLIEFYKTKGRFNVIINPQFINVDDNSLKLIFDINEGDILEVKDVHFVGNKEFSE
ncbi:MAG: POTRA domain-containing protein, partial [Paracoccaceae bacterium]|nr:POTRA domain-containing protein [Paracoccaceae bacterium]